MAQTQAEIQKRSDEKRGVKLCSFKFDTETRALLDELAAQTGQSKTAILAQALREFADKMQAA